jgi:type IV secretory pathway VirB10-like protein
MKKQISSVFISQESHRTYKDPAFFISSNFEFPKAKFDNQISNVIAKLKVIKEWFQTKVETKNSIFIVTRQKDEKEIPVFNWILNPKSQKLKEAIGILSDLYLILTQSKNEFSIPSLSKASSPSIRTARSVAPPPPPPPPGLNAPPPPPPAPGLNAPPPPPPPKKTEDKKNSALELIKQRKKANELKKQQALKEQESQTKNECDRISLVRVKPQLKEYTEDIRKQAEEEYKNDNQTQKVSIIDLFALAEDN